MSIISLAKDRLSGTSLHDAEKLEAFMSGYVGESLPPALGSHDEYVADWQHGHLAHQNELRHLDGDRK